MTGIQHWRGRGISETESDKMVGTDLQNVFKVPSCKLFHCRNVSSKLLNGIATESWDLLEPVSSAVTPLSLVHQLGSLLCVEQVDCSPTDRIKDLEGVCGHIFFQHRVPNHEDSQVA